MQINQNMSAVVSILIMNSFNRMRLINSLLVVVRGLCMFGAWRLINVFTFVRKYCTLKNIIVSNIR